MMTSARDYYALLGILRDATQEEIKSAYIAAAQRLHPDKNQAPGETEIFLEVQQAYETLSNPKRRSAYDATLPPDETASSPILHEVLYSRPSLVRLDETQIVYTLLTLRGCGGEQEYPAPPLNICLVLDRSTSMKDAKMDLLKSASVHFLRGLKPDDIFSVVAFSDRAEVIIPAGIQMDPQKLEMHVRSIQPGGATEMLQGLKAGLEEVRRGCNRRRVNHIILLTDGHTYGDEDGCLKLAAEAAGDGIGISTMGLGADWNDAFLDQVAGLTGSASHYIARPQDIQKYLSEKFRDLTRVVAEEVTLEGRLGDGIHLNYAFRLQPEAGPLSQTETKQLGPILRGSDLIVLFEFLVEPFAVTGKKVTFLEGALQVFMAANSTPLPPIRLRLERDVAMEPGSQPPPPAILQALSRLTLYRMQDRARQASQAGQIESATHSLKNLANHLLQQGHRDLAHTVLLEVEHLQKKRALSQTGEKEIKYATRALLMQERDVLK